MKDSDSRDARHTARMARKKAIVDEKIARASTERGLGGRAADVARPADWSNGFR